VGSLRGLPQADVPVVSTGAVPKGGRAQRSSTRGVPKTDQRRGLPNGGPISGFKEGVSQRLFPQVGSPIGER
jgi:hypothetical protein